MAILAYDNQLLATGALTDVGGTFDAAPPKENLLTLQVPGPYAQFTGTTAEFKFAFQDSVGAAESRTFRMLALLAHNLPDGASITWKSDAGTTIATQTWNRFGRRPRNLYTLLPSDHTDTSISCLISGVASGTYRIGAAFAGPVWEFDAVERWEVRAQNASQITRIGGTDWPFADARRRGIRVDTAPLDHEVMFGVPLPGNPAPTGLDVESIMSLIGATTPVIYAPRHSSQDWIDSTAIYGLVSRPNTTQHRGGAYHTAQFNVLEQG